MNARHAAGMNPVRTGPTPIRISPELMLPRDTVTSTLVIYGGKGMGKTNLGSVLVEELTAAGMRWAWLDPLGVSWGLRHDASGTGPGIECLILGGPRGDIPIEPEGGAAVADVVVEESVNVLIDFSRRPNGEMWSKTQRTTFVTAYAQRLFQRQGELLKGSARREPLMQILDEAARYIPQTIPSGDAQLAICVGAWEQIVEEGRNIGLGVCLLTQRSARMNKSVSELADAMFAFRTVGPNSLEAILDWLGTHVDKARAKELSEQVRGLEKGSALVVSPGWLKTERVVGIHLRTTFDSSATPKPGVRARTAKGAGAKPDLAAIQERMAATIERAKAEDPKELRKRLAQAERELVTVRAANLQLASASAKAKAEKPEKPAKPALTDSQVKRLETALGNLSKIIDGQLHGIYDRVLAATNDATTAAREVRETVARALAVPVARPSSAPAPASAAPHVSRPAADEDFDDVALVDDGGDSVPVKVLRALAQHGELAPKKLALLAGVKLGGSTYRGALAKGRNEGLIEKGKLALTAAGREAMRGAQPLPTGPALRAYWLTRLGAGVAGRMFRVLTRAWPRSIDAEALAEGAADGSPLVVGGSTWRGGLAKLRGLELVPRGQLKASDELFEEGR